MASSGVVAVVVGLLTVASACVGGGDEPAPPDDSVEPTETAVSAIDGDATDALDDLGPVDGDRCQGDGYEMAVPTGWFHFECRVFNVEPITVDPATCDCQFPIDVAVVRTEAYDDALTRIAASPAWRTEDRRPAVIDGREATRLDTVVTENGAELSRRIYLVGLDEGTLFLAATSDADQAPVDLLYDATLAGAAEIVESMTLR